MNKILLLNIQFVLNKLRKIENLLLIKNHMQKYNRKTACDILYPVIQNYENSALVVPMYRSSHVSLTFYV